MPRIGLSARAGLMFVAFSLQNAERTFYLPGWLRAQRPEFDWPGPAQYGVAAALLTLLAAGIVVGAGQALFAGVWAWAVACLAGALAVNAASHVLMSLANFSIMPGVVTGVALQAPVAIWVLVALVEDRRLTARGAAIATLAGAALIPVAAAVSLRLAEWLLA